MKTNSILFIACLILLSLSFTCKGQTNTKENTSAGIVVVDTVDCITLFNDCSVRLELCEDRLTSKDSIIDAERSINSDLRTKFYLEQSKSTALEKNIQSLKLSLFDEGRNKWIFGGVGVVAGLVIGVIIGK